MRTGKKVKRNANHEPALILSVTVSSQNGLSVMREIPIGNLRTSGTASLIRKWYQRNVRISQQVIDNQPGKGLSRKGLAGRSRRHGNLLLQLV